MRTLLIPLCMLILAGCGYSLRGVDSLDGFDTLALNLQEPGSDLSRLLRRSLESAGVEIIQETDSIAATDRPTLNVGNERVASRPVSVNTRARAAQYEIRVSVDILLTRGEQTPIPQQTLTVERSYLEDIENIAGSQEEVEIITTEMRRELVNQLIRRLEAADTNP